MSKRVTNRELMDKIEGLCGLVDENTRRIDKTCEDTVKNTTEVAVLKNNITWLKRGYWLQAGISIGAFAAVVTLVAWVVSVVK